jgi:hypothetical protein
VLDFGGPRDNDRSLGILKGKLSLTQAEVSSTFDGVVSRIMDSCLHLLRGRKVQVSIYFVIQHDIGNDHTVCQKHLLLVGGFGESPFLRARLKEAFALQGADTVTVDEPSLVIRCLL